MDWTAKDIPDQSGRTAIVTGANSGLGLEVASALADSGATVLMACRDMDRASEGLERIRAETPGVKVDALRLDLASLESVEEFAAAARNRFPGGIDILINNAGVMMPPQRETEDGFELQFGTNHLGHFALTARLYPDMRPVAGSRVVTVSSAMARTGRLDFENLGAQKGYSRTGAYSLSKLANLSFALELQRRLTVSGSPVESMAAHPGYSSTNLQKSGPRLGGGIASTLAAPFMSLGNLLLAQDATAGAAPILYAATDPGLAGGSYVGPDGPGEMRGSPVVVEPVKSAKDRSSAERLWAISEQMTGIRFTLQA